MSVLREDLREKRLGLIGAVFTGAALMMVWQVAYGRAAADARAEIAQIERKAR